MQDIQLIGTRVKVEEIYCIKSSKLYVKENALRLAVAKSELEDQLSSSNSRSSLFVAFRFSFCFNLCIGIKHNRPAEKRVETKVRTRSSDLS